MSVLIDRLMGRIRKQQIETIASATDEYRALLIQAATDEDSIDLDEIPRLCELMSKSLEDFKKDLELMRDKRLPAAEILKTEAKTRAAFAAAQAKLDQLNEEATAWRNAQSVKIQAAWQEVRRLENETAEVDRARATLFATVIDESLAERERDIHARMRELRERREQVTEAQRQSKAGIATCERECARYEEILGTAQITNEQRDQYKKSLQGYRDGRLRIDEQVSKYGDELSAIDADERKLRAELSKIEQQKLIP